MSSLHGKKGSVSLESRQWEKRRIKCKPGVCWLREKRRILYREEGKSKAIRGGAIRGKRVAPH